MTLTRAQIKELVHYDPDTGVFTHLHKDRKWFANDLSYFLHNKRWEGKPNGTIQTKGNGYRRVKVSLAGKQYLAHRIAWIYMTGDVPPKQIDHIDGDGLNNRWGNLRDGSIDNQRNKGIQRNNRSGVTGVSWSQVCQKWATRVWITEGGRRVYRHFGMFETLEAATAAVEKARRENGYSERHGADKPY